MVAVVSEHLALRRVGRRYQGLCPFHSEKTPSFSVNPELGLYHCFGCGAGGHPIRVARGIAHPEVHTTVLRLVAQIGRAPRCERASITEVPQSLDNLVEATAAAVAFYH